MSAFASLGPEQSGSRLAEQDSIQNFVRMAQGQNLQAQAQQEQMKTAQMQKELQAMSQLTTPDGAAGPGAGGSLADIPAHQARELVRSGFPVQAAKMFEISSRIRQDESAAAENAAQTAKFQYEASSKVLTTTAQFAQGIRNQHDWEAAAFMTAKMFPGAPNPFQGPYDPTKLGVIQAQAIQAKDRAKLALDATNAQSQVQLRNARAGYLSERLTQHEAELERKKARDKVLEKQGGSVDKRGGKSVASPTAGEQDAARRLVRDELPGVSTETLALVTDAVASEAKALVAATPGLDMDQARRRALKRRMDEGDIQIEKGMLGQKGIVGVGGDKYKFKPAGETPDAAIPDTPQTKHEPGKFYKFPRGVGRYEADGTVTFGLTPSSRAVSGTVDDDEED